MKNLEKYARLAIVVFTLAGCAAAPPPERTTGEFIDDTAITAKVKATLLNDPAVSGTDIKVQTYRGTVRLSGFVDSRTESDRAEALTRSIPGIRSVENDIRLNN